MLASQINHETYSKWKFVGRTNWEQDYVICLGLSRSVWYLGIDAICFKLWLKVRAPLVLQLRVAISRSVLALLPSIWVATLMAWGCIRAQLAKTTLSIRNLFLEIVREWFLFLFHRRRSTPKLGVNPSWAKAVTSGRKYCFLRHRLQGLFNVSPIFSSSFIKHHNRSCFSCFFPIAQPSLLILLQLYSPHISSAPTMFDPLCCAMMRCSPYGIWHVQKDKWPPNVNGPWYI